jgi:acetolactate synthase-1/2/3 large subunit
VSTPRVADLIARTLKARGVEVFFLLTGGDQSLWFALRDAGIRMILCRSEQGSTYMADGYARISGRPGLVYGQSGPGAANVAGSLPDPMWAGSPVVSITSSVPSATRDRLAYQEVDQLGLFAPVTKWNKAVQRGDRAVAMLRDAIRSAVTPPVGPVHLDLSGDLFEQRVPSADPGDETAVARVPELRTAPDEEPVGAIVECLLAAKRPLIIAGTGVVSSEAWNELRELAERLRISVVTTVGGKGAIPEDHPLALGVVGRYSRKVANEIAAKADVVLVVGSRLGSLSSDDYRVPSSDARILHIDADPRVLGSSYREFISVQADAKLALRALNRVAGGRHGEQYREWTADSARRSTAWKAELRAMVDERRSTRPLHPAVVLDVLRMCLRPEDIVVADTGYMAAWAGALFEIRAAGRVFIRAAGSLGWAIPAAIGAAIAAPHRRVACVTGDGGAGYNIAELETAARCGIPLVVLVMNNGSLAFEYQVQRYKWNGDVVPEANDFSDVDYAAVARGFGARGARVETAAELERELNAAFAAGGPTLLDVRVDKEAIAPVTSYDAVLERRL